MKRSLRPTHDGMSKRNLAVAVAVVLAAAAALVLADPLPALRGAFGKLDDASPGWLVAAGGCFLVASLCSASAWHRGLAACGSKLGRWQVTRRYAAGSLANTLAPANAGEVVRVALLSRAMGTEGATFTVVGVSAVVGIVRGALVLALFTATAATRVSPLWILGSALGVALLVAAGIVLARARFAGKVRHVLDAVRGLAAHPLAALDLAAWIAAGIGAMVLASACVGAALGVPHPVLAALVIVPAMELAKVLPITPGNVGLTSAAVAIALQSRGVPLESAVAAGITLHAVETVVGLGWGTAGTLSLTPALSRPRPLSWLRPRLTRALPGAAPTALLVGLALASFGAYTALT